MKAKNPSFKALISNPIHFLAFGFGSGLSPVAPGTVGTLMAVPLLFLLAQLNLVGFVLVTVIVSLAGIYICGKTARDMGVHDHGGIVWDEFAGYFITMLPLQTLGSVYEPGYWFIALIGFIAFRFFDALKPWPISWFDKNIEGGLGIMLDDIIAALPSLAVVQLFVYYFW